jgi:hypothetical protein
MRISLNFIVSDYNRVAANAPHAAALRVLADFIFAFCFHFISHNHLPLPTNPALRLHARYAQLLH